MTPTPTPPPPPLPIELLRLILSFISLPTTRTSTTTLYSLSLTSKLFHEIAQEELYLAPCLVDVPCPDHFIALERTLREKKELGERVRGLKLKSSHWQTLDMDILEALLKACPNLEELYLKTMDIFGICELLSIPTNLRTVYLSACTIHTKPHSPSLPLLSSILHLSISSCTFDRSSFPSSQFASLQSLSLSCEANSPTDLFGAGMYSSLFGFIQHLPKNCKLRGLRMYMDDLPKDPRSLTNYYKYSLRHQTQLHTLELGRQHIPSEDLISLIPSTGRNVNVLDHLPSTPSILRIGRTKFAHSVILDLLTNPLSKSGMIALSHLGKVEILGSGEEVEYRERKETVEKLREACRKTRTELVERGEGEGEEDGPDGFFRCVSENGGEREGFLLRGCEE